MVLELADHGLNTGAQDSLLERSMQIEAIRSSRTWVSIVDARNRIKRGGNPSTGAETSKREETLFHAQVSSYEIMCKPFKFCTIATLAGGTGKGRLGCSYVFMSLRNHRPGPDVRFGRGLFLIRTTSEDDIKLITSPERWHIRGRLLITEKWYPIMQMKIENTNQSRKCGGLGLSTPILISSKQLSWRQTSTLRTSDAMVLSA